MLRSKILGEVLLGRDRAADDAEFVRLMAEDIDRFSILLKSVGVEIDAHQRLGLFELDIEPGGDIREPALRGGELIVAANERLGQAARDPFVTLPDITAQDHKVLRREDRKSVV